MVTFEQVERLVEIREELETLIGEADDLVRDAVGHNDLVYRRAESYWLAHIKGALSKELRGSMFTMEETLNELEAELNEAVEESSQDGAEGDVWDGVYDEGLQYPGADKEEN